MGSKAKKPKKTSEEKARERYQAIELDQQIAESEQKFKALARNKLGAQSLLGGAVDAPKYDSKAPKSKYEKVKPKKKKKLIPRDSQGGDSGNDGDGGF